MSAPGSGCVSPPSKEVSKNESLSGKQIIVFIILMFQLLCYISYKFFQFEIWIFDKTLKLIF